MGLIRRLLLDTVTGEWRQMVTYHVGHSVVFLYLMRLPYEALVNLSATPIAREALPVESGSEVEAGLVVTAVILSQRGSVGSIYR